MSPALGWEDRASEWIAWTRSPAHDAYWRYRDGFLSLVPAPGAATLEIGCGEGRVSRDLAALGHAVTGLDASPTLLAAAVAAHPEGTYVRGVAEALPFPAAAFDLVVAHNVLMDVDDMPAAVAEAARVLRPGGRLCVAVTHPFADAGRFESEDADAPFVVTGSYLAGGPFELTVERDGLTMRFDGRAHTFEAYSRALEDAALLIEALREPSGPDPRFARIPMFLQLRAVKPAA